MQDLDTVLFADRTDAGRALAAQVKTKVRDPDVLVLALPRGGVPVGFEVARALGAPLDVFLVRKLGMPGEEELAIGAIASGGVRVLNRDLIRYLRVSASTLEEITAREQVELERRERSYREGRPPLEVKGRTIVLVDDGLATGASMLAAARALRQRRARRIFIAVPVAARQTCEDFRKEVDEIICVATPEPFNAVGVWYQDFSQTSDEDVRNLLEQANGQMQPTRPSYSTPA